jgi:GAF domain-containing protein
MTPRVEVGADVRSCRVEAIPMRSSKYDPGAAAAAGQAGGPARVRAGAPRASEADAHLSQSERAARALQRDRAAREVPIDRAFLEAALELGETLRTLVAAVVPRLAEWCWVDLVDADGLPRRVEVAHADPAHAPIAAEMRSLGFGPDWATPSAQAIRDRAPRVYRELTKELLEWATHDERHLGVLRAMKASSLAAVPLVARNRVIGALTLVRSSAPGLDEEALLQAERLAAPAALAIDNARRYEAERAARVAAEEALRADAELRRLDPEDRKVVVSVAEALGRARRRG